MNSRELNILLDDPEHGSIGPAAGLLAAHATDPEAHWLVLACDYPVAQFASMRQLLQEFEGPVTCFENEDGFCEPLFALWSPEALEKLAENVEKGKTGPSWTVREMGGKLIKPRDSRWLINTNTPEEWNAALTLLQQNEDLEVW